MRRNKPTTATAPRYDIRTVKDAASGRWMDILSSVAGLPPDILDGKHHPCPQCGGTDRFRLIDSDLGACLCNQCFREHNGDGLAAIQWACRVHIGEAVKRVADYLGLTASEASGGGNGHAKPKSRPDDHLTFHAWCEPEERLAALWCLKKKGPTVTAIKAAGGLIAQYRGKYTVVAMPIYTPGKTPTVDGMATDPAICGWVLWNVTGRPLPVWKRGGDQDKPDQVKMLTTSGSKAGLMGRDGLIALAAAGQPPQEKIVWKTAGPSDLLTLWAAIDSIDGDIGHVCVTNSGGETENVHPLTAAVFSGHDVRIVHDADQAGETGAAKWLEALRGVAAKVRQVRLPYEITDTHGKDLRDWLGEDGHGLEELCDLADSAEVIEEETVTAIQPTEKASSRKPIILESDDDPHRLARVNLERYAIRNGGRSLRYWRDEWYTWKRNAYRRITEKEFRAKLANSIKEEFDRQNIEAQAEFTANPKEGQEPPTVRKVSLQVVSATLQATSGMVVLSSDTEPGTWLPTRQQRQYVSMQNGLIDVGAVMADKPEADCILPNTPDWFSMVSLPFAFDIHAQCPKWMAFLERNLEGDQERISVLQEWAGYLLLQDTGEQKFMVLEGEGANGKSVFIAALTAMLGEENVSNIPLEVFGDRFSRTDTLGKLLNSAGDCGDIDKVAEGYIKSFTGGDRMFFDRKGVSGINCRPTARLMLACNNRPRFSDRSEGIWRRMLLVPWLVEIPANERVKGMTKGEWWRDSGELPGIFNWAILGLARLREQGGFTPSALMSEALQDYQEETNPARIFLTDHIEPSTSSAIKAAGLYSFYARWAKDNGYHPLSARTFGKEIKRCFKNAHRKRGGTRGERYWFYEGIAFSQDVICGEETDAAKLFQ